MRKRKVNKEKEIIILKMSRKRKLGKKGLKREMIRLNKLRL